MMRLSFPLLPAFLSLAIGAAAQPLVPGTSYDPQIPTLEQVVGHDHGQEITTPEQVNLYLHTLAQAAESRTRLIQYARSWEGRPLYLLIIGSPDHIAQLDEVQRNLQALADPRGKSTSEIDSLISETPVAIWLLHGIHGDEISSTDAALAEAYHILAARGDEAVDTILRESLVLIDPMENPDGRARFIYQNLLGRAAVPDPEPWSAEHDQPWPSGRSNHYLFDMNRDWFAQTQPETRGRVRVYLNWKPQVAVDFHEMGGDSTYFFPPDVEPVNPSVRESQVRWLDTFGRVNAAKFDQRGFSYFIREEFDLFYPGYADAWPMLQGAIGMTFEQGSASGLVFRREDETLLSFRDGVLRHFTAALTTAETAARNREQILRDFVDTRRGVTDGPVRAYLFAPTDDAGRSRRLASQLVAQGIEVFVSSSPIEVAERSLPSGTYVIPLAQPAGRLASTLLAPDVPISDEFVEEQDRRRRRREGNQFYDITAWSLPLLYDVDTVASATPIATNLQRFEPEPTRDPSQGGPTAASSPPDANSLPTATVAYLMPWGIAAAATVVEALDEGLQARFADRGFTLNGREYPPGTVIFRVSDNDDDLAERLGAVSAHHDSEVVAANTGWVDAGISLGSDQVHVLKSPRVLLAWDTPTSSLSAGWARYVLERRYGQPVTIVRVTSLANIDLNRFDVLILPSGDYASSLADDWLNTLRVWIRGGGTLVTLAEASRWAARESTGLLDTRTELRDGSPEVESGEPDEDEDDKGEKTEEHAAAPSTEAADETFDLEAAIQPDRERPEQTPGSILRVQLETHHWLSVGTDGEIQAIVEGRRVFTPIKLGSGTNVGVYAPRGTIRSAGFVWEEAQKLLAQKAFLIDQPMGKGHLIAFAEDVNFRGLAETTQLLFMNAVLLGPAH